MSAPSRASCALGPPEQQLDLLAPQEVAVDRVGDVRPHARRGGAGWRAPCAARARRPATWPPGPRPRRRGRCRSARRRSATVTRIASMSMAASAARSMVAWKVLRGRPNWWRRVEVRRRLGQRRLADADLQRAQRDGGGDQQEVERRRGPGRGRRGRPPAATATPARCRCGWISRLVVTARSSATPAARGSTSASSTPPSSLRAGTTMRAARWAWGTASSVPSSTHPSPARRGPHGRGRRRAERAAVQRRGEDHLAGDDAGQPARPLRLRAEVGDGEGAQHEGGPQRHGRHRVALRLEQEAQLHEAVAGAAVGLGHGEAQQVGVGQGLPQVAVDALVARSTAATRSGSTRPEKSPVAASETASCSSLRAKSIRPPPPPPHRRPARTPATTAPRRSRRTRPAAPCPTSMASGSTPPRLATTRVPSSSSTRPIGSGYSNAGHLRVVHDDVGVQGAPAARLRPCPTRASRRRHRPAAAGGAACRTTCSAGSAAGGPGPPRTRTRCPG